MSVENARCWAGSVAGHCDCGEIAVAAALSGAAAAAAAGSDGAARSAGAAGAVTWGRRTLHSWLLPAIAAELAELKCVSRAAVPNAEAAAD